LYDLHSHHQGAFPPFHVLVHTCSRFAVAREKKHLVTTRMIRFWALSAAMQYELSGFTFIIASGSWTDKFKQDFSIRQRKVTRYVW